MKQTPITEKVRRVPSANVRTKQVLKLKGDLERTSINKTAAAAAAVAAATTTTQGLG